MMDYHIHSAYSADGRMSMEMACLKAIELGLSEIAFTDHIDLDWPDPNIQFNIQDLDNYFKEIELMQRKFQGKLSIKKGIEIGLQPHVLDDCSRIINAYPFDFVIGSIHLIDGIDPYEGDYYRSRTKEESYKCYYREALSAVKDFDDFDVLGHLDYIKRYSPFPYKSGDDEFGMEIVESILKVLVKKNKGIEINTSGYRHPSDSPMPSLNTVSLFKKLGGNIITLGSDAHDVDGIAFQFPRVLAQLESTGFTHLTSFSHRKPRFIKI